MQYIIVQTNNSRYNRITRYKGEEGLGVPYELSDDNPSEIIVVNDNIQYKLNQLITLNNRYKSARPGELRGRVADGGLGGVGTNEPKLIAAFSNFLADILFTYDRPSDAAEYFGYNTSFPNLDAARDYIVEVLNEWIDLFQDILQPTVGLSKEYVGPQGTTQTIVVTGIDEESRTDDTRGNITVSVQNIDIPLTSAIISAASALIDIKTTQFFDESREYKTILNFGDDNQYAVEAWRIVPNDTASVQLKLLKPLTTDVDLYQQSYIVREFANTVIDTITIETPPEVDFTPHLRPANMNVGKYGVNKQSVNNITINTLGMATGSYGNISGSNISYDDRVFNRWYTADFNSSELNIDFSDYNNFVFFGSAEARLSAFANKLSKIQSYGTGISLSSSIDGERKLALEQEYIKRNFDPYEQYLYYASQSNAYSASVYYVDSGTEYNSTGSWPKDNSMIPLTYQTVSSWYETQRQIAQRFDEFNANYLVKHLPAHIQEDENSIEFIKFIQMFGHVMDNLKVYIDQFSNIYSTNPDPFQELSMDQVYEVATSFGLDLPNAYALESLQSFIASLYDGVGARSMVAETWKRFIHSAPYLRKIKGSKTGTDAVLNTYGLNSPLVQVKESAYAIEGNYIQSDELVYALEFTGSISSSIQIPFVSSSYTGSSLQLRFIPETRRQSTVLSSATTWAIDLVPHPSSSTEISFSTQSINSTISYFTLTPPTIEYGKINIVSGSGRTIIASSSYFPLFSDTYTHIMLRSQSQDVTIIQTDGDQILHREVLSVSWGNLWNNTNVVYIGGSGSIKNSTFDGIVDDVRLWGEEVSNDNFTKQAYDPGSYYGSSYSSSYNSLYVDLSFSQPYAAITQSATNESPFYNVAKLSNLPAYGFTTESYVRILRTIKQYTPIVGATAYSDKKVTVAPAPEFTGQFIDDNGTKILQMRSSIKSVEEKRYVGGQDYVQFAVSPTDFINQTIIRSMGDIDTNYLIGSPRKMGEESYTELDDVFDFFLEKYNESINPNEYIRFFSNILKAPSEYIESYVPARAKLLDGVVIDSPILDRTKTYVQKSIKVDGSNTKTFESFVAGSGSADVGAYDFLAEYPSEPEPDTTIITNPVMQKFGNSTVTSSLMSTNGGIGFVTGEVSVTDTVDAVSSTAPNKLPENKQFLQQIGNRFVSTSLADNNSGIGFVESELDASPNIGEQQTGYLRNPYLGLTTGTTQILRIPSEENTLEPFYDIKPLSDFSDVGTTTYFYNNTGVLWFIPPGTKPTKTPFTKQRYLAKLDVPIGEIQSVATKEFSKITLLDPTVETDYPDRATAVITNKQYAANNSYKGVLNIANIFSLYNINGASGLRLRLYRTTADQNTDLDRDFATLPSSTAGVLFDGILEGSSDVFPYTLVQTENSTVYFTVNNLTASDISTQITLTYFEYEPANLIPLGYLPRHYRFTRTNNTAARRRSYLGCRAVYCPEGCPPGVTATTTISPWDIEVANTPQSPQVDRRFSGPDNTLKFGGRGPLK